MPIKLRIKLNTKRAPISSYFGNVKRNEKRTENAAFISREKNAKRPPIELKTNWTATNEPVSVLQDHIDKETDLEEKKDELDDDWYDEFDVEDEEDERQREKRDKDQEYNLFVKSNRKRGNCTTKKSKRPRSRSQ